MFTRQHLTPPTTKHRPRSPPRHHEKLSENNGDGQLDQAILDKRTKRLTFRATRAPATNTDQNARLASETICSIWPHVAYQLLLKYGCQGRSQSRTAKDAKVRRVCTEAPPSMMLPILQWGRTRKHEISGGRQGKEPRAETSTRILR